MNDIIAELNSILEIAYELPEDDYATSLIKTKLYEMIQQLEIQELNL